MDNKSLEILEFPRIREILADFASFSASRELALGLQPSADYETVSLLLRQSAEARHLLAREPDFSIGGVRDVREEAKMAALGKVLESAKLVEIHDTLGAVSRLRSRLSKLSNEFPKLWCIAQGIVELRQLEKDIGSSISSTGEVLDSVSPKLANTRQRLRQARGELLKRLDGIMKGTKGRTIIQEHLITEREGRYVIPVKVECRREIKGIVHDVSNTGATVFVEPWATMELGNELRELALDEKREIERILGELSNKVGAHEAEIRRNVELVAELDMALAKARYAQRARATEPTITSFDGKAQGAEDEPSGLLRLIAARHPLLAEKAVPLSVELGRDFSVLVITGPNTGGKTVALKTMGLLSLMMQAGIPIPAAAESCLPMFDNVFADIGDEQSIEQTLSSFSWHIGNVVRVIGSASKKSLVLLDELGTSTDPEEGSALARSILLHFLSRGTLTVATTHYGALKAFAHATRGMQNASFDFDPVTLSPTYCLIVGIPGGSNALATASRLGVPAEIVDQARGMLSKGNQELETLLTDLVKEKRLAEELRNGLERDKAELEVQRRELLTELQKLRAEGQKLVRETKDAILMEAAKLQKEIRQAVSELGAKRSKDSIERARKAVAATQQALKSEVWKAKVVEGEEQAAAEGDIAVGDMVWVRDADIEARVLSVSQETGQVEVQAGRARLNLSLESVSRVAPSPEGEARRFVPVRRRLSGRIVKEELDLRGKRADEVEPLLDRYLNDAYLSSLSQVRIVHGVGTGTVRDIVREVLASHSLVKSFRAGGQKEGGDGVTVVEM
ncbi:MAG: endonuclease MutS2 [Chloroflexi bacterium]|nr:endonuclease MutS2 [Chloroflexota bacterium]MBM3176044.1 endonuclease MutS2 [Chloroflexota bacterium]